MTDTLTTDEQWRMWRRGGVGASDVPAIMGVSPYASPWSTWADKVGLTDGPDESLAMTFGRDLEPVIGTWFERETELFVTGEQTMCTHPAEPWARATVDGFVVEAGYTPKALALGVFEAKFTGQSVGDDLPEHYLYQVQWQMWVTDTDRAWVAVMSLPFGRPTFQVFDVARDPDLIGRCVDACRAFWHDHVLTGTPPPVDASAATTAAIADAYGHDAHLDESVQIDDIANLIEQLRLAKDNAKQIGRDIDELENAIKARLGTATVGTVDGEPAITWREQSSRRLDQKALRAADPDLVDKFTSESSFRVLRLKKASG